MSFRDWRLATIWPYLAFLVLATIIYTSQLNFDSWLRTGPAKIPVDYNVFIEPQPLSPAMTKASSFGAHEFLADVYWLELIQYYGGGVPNGQYRKLPDLFNVITDLSPKFVTAYQDGLLILPGEGFKEQALALSAKGKQNLPDRWEIPYFTGLVYHIYYKDYAKAAQEFQEAAAKPGAPANTEFFAALYYKQSDQKQIAYQLFQTIYQNSTDSYIKDRAKKYLGHLEGSFVLEDAIKQYQTRYGHLPATLDDLVTGKILTSLPVSPLNFPYNYDPSTGQINEGK